MINMEKKKAIKTRVNNLEILFSEKYEQPFLVNGKKCFKASDKEFFMVTGISSFGAVVIEHALSVEEAKKNMFEDGEIFYINELEELPMFEQMLKEIEEI